MRGHFVFSILAWFVCCAANASESLYIKLSAGLMQYNPLQSNNSSIYEHKNYNKARPTFEGGVGYEINEYLQVETLLHKSTLHYVDKKSAITGRQKIKTLAAMANIYLTPVSDGNAIIPFIMAGCGLGYNKASNWQGSACVKCIFIGHKNKNFIWAAGGGIRFKGLSKNYSCEIGYKYLDLGRIKVDRALQNVKPLMQYPLYQRPKLSGHQVTASLNIYL